MPILTADIKLLKSGVMSDVPEGGGAPTGTAITDGASNSIFPDISELDRAGGRVNMRKLFVGVQTDDRDSYFGANVIVAEPPQDPRVSVSMFTTRSTFDTRAQAASRVEAYLNAGPDWPGYLYENHIAGQRVIQLFQRPNAEAPAVGRTLVLVYDEGKPTQRTQYVRATAVSVVIRQFYDPDTQKDFDAAIVSVSISDALRQDFEGSPASRSFTRKATGTRVRDTVVADAGSYVGVVPLASAASLGDFTVAAQSIFTQLVPSAQTETPITFALPYGPGGLPLQGPEPISYTANHAWTTTTNLFLPGGCLPGSFTLTSGATTVVDDAGVLRSDGQDFGTIDYANGILTINAGSMNGAKAITYTPATTVLRAPESSEIRVTQESRAQNYTGVIVPTPQPGTLSVAYRAQGRWYVLADAGNGVLKGGDASFGAGTYNPTTGAYVLTLGALPDAGSSIVLTWNNPTQETQQPVADLKASMLVSLPSASGQAMQPGSLSLSWNDGTARTATANAAGVLAGAATGSMKVAQGLLEFAPNVLPPVGTIVTANWTAGPKTVDTFPALGRNPQGDLIATASAGAITPGSLEIEWKTRTDLQNMRQWFFEMVREMAIQADAPTLRIARDDGAGGIVYEGTVIGTVNYATGQIAWAPDVLVSAPLPSMRYPIFTVGPLPTASTNRARTYYAGMQYVASNSAYFPGADGAVTIRYNTAGSTNNETAQFVFAPSFRLVPAIVARVVPGSVVLRVTGADPWGDNGQGLLREYTVAQGWVQRGTINYVDGVVTLTSWNAGTTNTLQRAACTTAVGETVQSEFVFRTAAAPLRPGSLSIQFARAVGGTQSVTANINGTISGPNVSGTVDYEMGLVRLMFGQLVTAAGNESQPWYDAGLVDEDGKIFKPAPIAASSLRYNAVAFSYLPLDADVLGIDPVRLPTDGRVPIFRPGGFAVVGHTGKITATVSNGQTINCGRVRLSRVRVVGANGQVINTGYTANLEDGLVTFTNVSGYSQPVTIEHRIEDMAVIRETQISGQVSFTRPLTHDYPLGSYVSSALVAGDLFARVQLIFDQQTWNNAWDDTVSGSAAVGTFNATQYPIVVTNRGALTERWAVVFTGNTTFNVIGENVGVIATGSTGADCAPINPATGVPYFTIPAAGWGAGWVQGNAVRFNTIGASFPVWVVRTVQQGPETVPEDQFTILARGDVDTP